MSTKINQDDNIDAVRQFWQSAKYTDRGATILLNARIVYEDKILGTPIFCSDGPKQVIIDNVQESNVLVPCLGEQEDCFCEFWTRFQKMEFKNGVLSIEGDSYGTKHAYRVTLMPE